MKKEDKQKAIKWRKRGKSLSEISAMLGVSKGSVSAWVKEIILTETQKKSLEFKYKNQEVVEKRRISRLKNEEEKRSKLIFQGENEGEKLLSDPLFLTGTALYFAEGGKSQRGLVRFSNSDPRMIQIMMKFFSSICNVPREKFRGHIHMYDHKSIQKVELYWSSVSGIDRKQFFKTYCKKSHEITTKRILEYGTFDIYVCDTNLFLKLQGWINLICKRMLNNID